MPELSLHCLDRRAARDRLARHRVPPHLLVVAEQTESELALQVAVPDAHALLYDKPLCASLNGFTLHAATRAGGPADTGRGARLRYVLRPPNPPERGEPPKAGLGPVALKRADADGH